MLLLRLGLVYGSPQGMARLRELRSGGSIELEAETTLGRSPSCTLCLQEGSVSALHASIRWLGDVWHVRDLGSRNGTWHNQRRLGEGESRRLSVGDVVQCGKRGAEWRLADEAPPARKIVHLDSGRTFLLAEGPVALPSEHDVSATVYEDRDGSAVLESDSAIRSLRDGELLEFPSARFRVVLPVGVAATQLVGAGARTLAASTLRLTVSRNEEHVGLQVLAADGELQRPAPRQHNYLLLALARERVADAARGLSEREQGWLGTVELCKQLRYSRPQLNTDVYRIRLQFRAMGWLDAGTIIERRADSGDLRLSVAHVEIT